MPAEEVEKGCLNHGEVEGVLLAQELSVALSKPSISRELGAGGGKKAINVEVFLGRLVREMRYSLRLLPPAPVRGHNEGVALKGLEGSEGTMDEVLLLEAIEDAVIAKKSRLGSVLLDDPEEDRVEGPDVHLREIDVQTKLEGPV